MRAIHSLLRWIRSLFAKDANNTELSEELQFHLERAVEENIESGMSPEKARAEARITFGSVTQVAEECYEARRTVWIEDLFQDLRYGLRTLLRHRSFTFVTVLTLALGIGACTAIFSLVDAVLIRSLPYDQPDRLVYLFTPNPRLIDLPPEVFGPFNADFFELKRLSHSFADMTLFQQADYNVAADGRLQRLGAAKVDADFFKTLQSSPEFGRPLGASDEQPGSDHVVVIGHAVWQGMFGGRSDIVDRTLRLDGTAYQIVGVMPPDFGYPHKSDLAYGIGTIDTTQLWLPSALTPQQRTDREDFGGSVAARLRPGVTLEEAQTEMSIIMSQLNLLHKPEMRGWGALVKQFRDIAVGPVKRLMWLLLGAVALVLLIACGNAANLLLARARNRTHELGVRATLGAQRGRLLRQLLTESLMLCVAAGVMGIGLAYVFLHTLLKLDPGDIPRMQGATLDLRVMAFLTLITTLTSVLFGIFPSFLATSVNLAEFVKCGGTRGILGGRRRARNGLVVSQVALVVALLTGAGLLLRSYFNVLSVPTGFSASTIVVNVQLTPQYDLAQKRLNFFKRAFDEIKRSQGIQAVGAVDYLPLSRSESLAFDIEAEGYPNKKGQMVEMRPATPEYFSAMQIPLMAGRTFNGDDGPGHPLIAIVNQAFAKKYLADRNPIGHRVRTWSTAPWMTIIGVVGDARNMSLEASVSPQLYTSFWQGNTDSTYIAVRSFLPQVAVVSQIRAILGNLDPNLAIADVHVMRDLESQAIARRRFQTSLLTLFSGIALFLAIVGVYGLLADSVRERTGEIGIRIALGSSKTRVVRLERY